MLLLNSFISVIFVQLFEDFCIPNLGATGLNADTFLDQEYFYSIEVAVHHHYTWVWLTSKLNKAEFYNLHDIMFFKILIVVQINLFNNYKSFSA